MDAIRALIEKVKELERKVAVLETREAGAGGTGVTDHGDLTGLGDDDHTQYHNNARGDARYAPIAKGVTNGDAHDHSGGDGGPINNVGSWVASGNTLHDGSSNIVLDGDDGRVDAHKLELPESATPAYPGAGKVRVFINASGQLCTVDEANNVVVYMPATHDHVGGDGNLVNHATGLTGHNTTNYTHLTAANHTDLTDGGPTALHKHAGQFVAVTPTNLVDSAGSTWNANAHNTGTYTFRPGDNSNIWPATASGLLLLIYGQWSSANGGYAVTVRQTSGGSNEAQVKALVANIGYNSQCVTLLDGSGYFYVLVEGANAAAATVRILGYFE